MTMMNDIDKRVGRGLIIQSSKGGYTLKNGVQKGYGGL